MEEGVGRRKTSRRVRGNDRVPRCIERLSLWYVFGKSCVMKGVLCTLWYAVDLLGVRTTEIE